MRPCLAALRAALLPLFGMALAAPLATASEALTVLENGPRVSAETLAVIVNEADPLSRQIAHYYSKKRGIPAKNIIYVNFPPGRAALTAAEFAPVYARVKKHTADSIQAYALTWALPYRVDCMSITSAMSFGYDPAFCATGCKTTRYSPYFNSVSRAPWSDTGVRPSMAIAASDFAQAKALIDRGVAADESWPDARGFVVTTADKNRSVRRWSEGVPALPPRVHMAAKTTDALRNESDLMFYFTGAVQVADIASNAFLPGAMADHLTSVGGVLNGTGQMSALRWLEGGATGSYGAVVEPCNFTSKFPNPSIAVRQYAQGDSLIEAYWKSVAMPGQGIFIGEPLARPYGGYRSERSGERVSITHPGWTGGRFSIEGASRAAGPFRQLAGPISPDSTSATLSFSAAPELSYFRINRVRP